MNLITFLLLQIDRIKSKPTTHSSGPKRPDLSTLDNSRPK